MTNTNFNRRTNKYATNLLIMRACYNPDLPMGGFRDYTKECRISGVEPVAYDSFDKYMRVQGFGFLKERDFTNLYNVMFSERWSLETTATHVETLLIVNGYRTDI